MHTHTPLSLQHLACRFLTGISHCNVNVNYVKGFAFFYGQKIILFQLNVHLCFRMPLEIVRSSGLIFLFNIFSSSLIIYLYNRGRYLFITRKV